MKTKHMKRFVYEGLGFPVALINVCMGKMRGVWTPLIDYNKLQKEVFLLLSCGRFPLSGEEVRFLRTYFEMRVEDFARELGISRCTVLNYEKTQNHPPKIRPLSIFANKVARA